MKKNGAVLIVLLLCFAVVSFQIIGIVKAETAIYIKADGTVEGTDKIHRNGNVYTLTGNIDVYKGSVPFSGGINVQRDHVVIDGCGYSIQAQEYVYSGINLAGRSNVTIKNMQIRDFNHGFFLDESSGNTISGNDISGASDNGYPVGFWVWNSSNNNIIGNKITDHNNFINNKVSDGLQVSNPWSWGRPETNVWDNGVEGNYWSDYTSRYLNATEIDGSGIGNTPFVINEANVDRCPLIVPIEFFDAGVWEWTSYFVGVVSNSSVSDFYFNPLEEPFLRFNVTASQGASYFCRVAVPKGLLWTSDVWTVKLNNQTITPTVMQDTENTYLFFTYNRSTKTAEIRGTDAIPEFPSWILLSLFTTATLAVIICKKRLTVTST